MIKLKDIAVEKAVELGVSPKAAAFAALGIGKCIQEKMKSVNLYDDYNDITPEELDSLCLHFNLYRFGRIQVKYPHFKLLKKRINNVKNRKDNTSV